MGNVSIGNIVTMGGEEWLVLEKEKGKILLLSKYIIVIRDFHNKEDVDISWNNCETRTWLNSEFLNTTFSTQEKSIIRKTALNDVKTEDKVFYLSVNEVEKYFVTNESRKASRNSVCLDSGMYSWWYLRNSCDGNGTLVNASHRVKAVEEDGEIGWSLTTTCSYGRPAMWIYYGE